MRLHFLLPEMLSLSLVSLSLLTPLCTTDAIRHSARLDHHGRLPLRTGNGSSSHPFDPTSFPPAHLAPFYDGEQPGWSRARLSTVPF